MGEVKQKPQIKSDAETRLRTCFIDSRMPYEDMQLKWALEDGDMGRRMNRRTGAACAGREVGKEGGSCGEQRGVR